MRRVGLYLLSLLWLSVFALPAHALVIEICVPDCSGENQRHTVYSSPDQTQTQVNDPATTADDVTTTTVPIPTVVVPLNATSGPRFTVSATVSSQQSGTLQKITFNPTTITANTDSGCSTGAPCMIEIRATSSPCDFPLPKPVGGYPAGAFMMGSFTGTQVTNNGDTIAMTGRASGATSSLPLDQCSQSDPLNRPVAITVDTDVINATPGTGPGNVGVSLPSSCTGIETCKFMASTFKKAFSTQITETVQQTCGEASSCFTRLQTRLNVELKTAGNRVTLPLEHVTANTDFLQLDITKKKNPTHELTQNLAPSLGGFDVRHLSISEQSFLLRAELRLESSNTIDPVSDEVFIRVGPFSMTIPPNSFQRLGNNTLFKFVGKVDGRDVTATFTRAPKDPAVWSFLANVHDVRLRDIPELQPPLLVPVEVVVGTNLGKDLVTARFP